MGRDLAYIGLRGSAHSLFPCKNDIDNETIRFDPKNPLVTQLGARDMNLVE